MTVEIGSLDDLKAESEASDYGEWFCLSGSDGRIYSLGQCADFEEAEATAAERKLDSVWLASPYVARKWREALTAQAETDEILAYRTAAQDRQRDGEIEIDANAIVSLGEDAGAYVQAWLWITDTEAGLRERITCMSCGDWTDSIKSPDGTRCPDCYDREGSA